MGDIPQRTGAIIVYEKRGSVHFLWGFLTVAFGSALVAGHVLAETTGGRIAGDVLFGLLLIGSATAWFLNARHPARLEITPDEIVFTHGSGEGTRLRHTGDLYLNVTLFSGGRSLRVTGSDEGIPIPIHLFDVEEIKRACVAAGWRFVDDPS